ncbi:Piso0_005701 [Millerozyma farinosa CBS 7064]|uniref:Piso0_005701 protein n=1 Tax=Pichia sorbitophila (strain ATCC MYA-4447 / BCRC 22081 / CBS 7064 / NBRC 10061 / NRRL Y-12695) TaxID=559304 RepID=G8Y2P3_PICSO|nr:Piso0_005701 [Millerozyma farinosa CBS 7064]
MLSPNSSSMEGEAERLNGAVEYTKKRPIEKEDTKEESPETKKSKLVTPEVADVSIIEDEDIASDSKQEKSVTKKQVEKLEKQKKREEEKKAREQKKEEERLQKEEEKRKKEIERQKKQLAKDQEKEERRKKLEEERIEREKKKEEERIRRQAEKEEREKTRIEKKKKLEEERERKELEKARKELEKKKLEEQKERSQRKISSYFSINHKATTSKQKEESSGKEGNNEPEETSSSVYHKVFLPFYQKKNVTMPNNRPSPEDVEKSMSSFDNNLNKVKTSSDSMDSNAGEDFRKFFKSYQEKKTSKVYVLPEQLVEALNSSSITESQIYEMIQNLPSIKYIQFYENAKPPYIGTWSSYKHTRISFPLSNPFDTSVSGLDYSYDSDAEWNKDDAEEGEGEDIENEEDEEDDDEIEEEDEMDDFVEGTDTKKKRKYLGPLVATSKWNDGTDPEFFGTLRYERLNIQIGFSIDPSANYWEKTKDAASANSIPQETIQNTSNSCSNSSNSPLQNSNNANTPNILVPHKPVIKDDKVVLDLIKFIEKNNEFTIGTLVELSKKEFKSFTKALLKHTIQSIATYNKKTGNWEVKAGLEQELLQSISR